MGDVRTQARFGWLPDQPKKNDYPLSLHLQALPKAPDINQVLLEVPKFNKRVSVNDQGNLGSCTANSGDELMVYVRGVSHRSRLQLYYEARRLIGMTEVDSGAYNRDIMTVISRLGAGRETWWPYDDGPDKFRQDPIDKVDRDALKRRIFTYYRLDNDRKDSPACRHEFAACLAEGFPFIIGFSVYAEFMSPYVASHGIVPLPDTSKEDFEGGHAVSVWGRCMEFHNHEWATSAMAKGLSKTRIPDQVYFVRNHWGDWGNQGNFAIDVKYFEDGDLADDAWTCRKAVPPVVA